MYQKIATQKDREHCVYYNNHKFWKNRKNPQTFRDDITNTILLELPMELLFFDKCFWRCITFSGHQSGNFVKESIVSEFKRISVSGQAQQKQRNYVFVLPEALKKVETKNLNVAKFARSLRLIEQQLTAK